MLVETPALAEMRDKLESANPTSWIEAMVASINWRRRISSRPSFGKPSPLRRLLRQFLLGARLRYGCRRTRKLGILRILYWSINQKRPLALARKRHIVTQSVKFVTAKARRFCRADVPQRRPEEPARSPRRTRN